MREVENVTPLLAQLNVEGEVIREDAGSASRQNFDGRIRYSQAGERRGLTRSLALDVTFIRQRRTGHISLRRAGSQRAMACGADPYPTLEGIVQR